MTLRQSAVERYNDGSYFAKHPTWDAEHSGWKAKNIKKILTKNNIDANKICEVGCGAGEILLELKKMILAKSFMVTKLQKLLMKCAKQKKLIMLNSF